MRDLNLTKAIGLEIDRQTESFRGSALLDFKSSLIQHMQPPELAVLQAKLGYGSNYGIWETPENWMPPGYSRNPGQLNVDFKRLLAAAGVLESRLEAAILCLSRYALLISLVPSGMGRIAGRYLKPSTISGMLQNACINIVATSASRPCKQSEEDYFFGSFDRQDLLDLPTKGSKLRVNIELQRALMLHHKGLWKDAPTSFEHRSAEASSNKGDDKRPVKEEKPERFLPLPDEYVAEVGWRALWIVKELGPGLLEVTQQLIEHLPSLEGSSVERRVNEISRLVTEYVWHDSKGNPIREIPFDLHIVGIGKREAMLWPPNSGTQLRELLKRLQMAHLWITLLSVGSRIGELLSMQPGAVVHSGDGTPFANGLTFKIVSQIGGAARDWPLPDVAAEALRQQEKLAEVIVNLGHMHNDNRGDSARADSLWLRIGSASGYKGEINLHLRDAIRSLGLSTEPDGQPVSTHRLRKTVARLVALAIAGAPKILMDLFGHKSIEMTLHYILSDPYVQAEIKAVVEAQVIMLAEGAIEGIESSGGPASKAIATTVRAERARLGSAYGAQDVRELAEILTMNGRHWSLVRPGVICTKLPGSAGPCTTKVGRPEPSRCSWSCDHRLEQAFLKDDVDRSIEEAVRMLDLELASQNEIQAEYWVGQVLAQVRRFDDLCVKWSKHPSVARLLNESSECSL